MNDWSYLSIRYLYKTLIYVQWIMDEKDALERFPIENPKKPKMTAAAKKVVEDVVPMDVVEEVETTAVQGLRYVAGHLKAKGLITECQQTSRLP